MRRSGPSFCPGCGERVSVFAAGCAYCGRALDPRRGQGPPQWSERVRAVLRSLRPNPRP